MASGKTINTSHSTAFSGDHRKEEDHLDICLWTPALDHELPEHQIQTCGPSLLNSVILPALFHLFVFSCILLPCCFFDSKPVVKIHDLFIHTLPSPFRHVHIWSWKHPFLRWATKQWSFLRPKFLLEILSSMGLIILSVVGAQLSLISTEVTHK